MAEEQEMLAENEKLDQDAKRSGDSSHIKSIQVNQDKEISNVSPIKHSSHS